MNNQSEDRVLGYVGTYPVGDYNAQTEYEYLNVVTHKGSSYVCIKEEGCTAIEPPNEECWQLFAGKGDQGEKGDTGDIGPIGPKPINGVDYNTEAEQKEFKDKVVADSKTDLEKYIAEKETHLDNYTKEKETELDDYVTDIVKTTIDTYVTDTTKKDIDAYEKEKEKALDTYTDTKKTEIDNYVTNTSKPALDQYEKEKEAELETAKNKAINEYDVHAESVLTETEDLFNALNTEKASGTELYIEDAKPCRIMSSEIGGMYKRETTTGKNLFDYITNFKSQINGLKNTLSEDGTITVRGSLTSGYSEIVSSYYITDILEDGETYTIANENPNNFVILQVIAEKKDGMENVFYTANENKSVKFVVNKSIYITYRIKALTTTLSVWGTESREISTRFMLYKGSDNDLFEKYTGGNASPNLNYPQAIKQVDSLQLKCVGSNLLDYTKILSTPSTTSGITIKLEENGNITISGKPKYSYFSVIQSKNIIDILKDGETYYLDQSNYNRYFYTEIQAVKVDGSITYIGPQKVRASFKVNKSLFKKYVIRIIGGSLSNWGEEERTITSNFKLTRQKDLPFEKYIEKTVNIDLKGNKPCAISNTIKDKLLIDKSGNVVLQKNVNKYIFTGNENFTLNSTTDSYNEFTCVISNLYSKNYFETKSNKFLYNLDNRISISDTGASYIRIPIKLQVDTIDKFKTIIKDTEVYYVLATPELIDLGQLTELPKTFEGINNIWAETNLGNTEIEIEYVQDVKKLLEKQAEQQNARLDNIETLLSTTQTSALLLDNMQTDLEKEVE